MRRLSTILMAAVLVLGLTQCKKETPANSENEGGKVSITLDVENGGNKHTVNPHDGSGTQATVNYDDGDVIYVGDGNHYIGRLTRTSKHFSGEINAPEDGTTIYFYFVGGMTPIDLTPSGSLVEGATTSFKVSISDQSENLPVLSFTSVTYYSGTSSYSCQLQNQCGLAEFTLENSAATVVVNGSMYTKAVINFASTPGISNDGTKGDVTLYNNSGATTKYAILLPQDAVSSAAVTVDGDSDYKAYVPAVSVNDFLLDIKITKKE